MSEWKPIETAPKDAGWVLLHVPACSPEHRVARVWNGEWLATGGQIVRPTHWMPLPASPLPEQEPGQ